MLSLFKFKYLYHLLFGGNLITYHYNSQPQKCLTRVTSNYNVYNHRTIRPSFVKGVCGVCATTKIVLWLCATTVFSSRFKIIYIRFKGISNRIYIISFNTLWASSSALKKCGENFKRFWANNPNSERHWSLVCVNLFFMVGPGPGRSVVSRHFVSVLWWLCMTSSMIVRSYL